MSRHNSLPNDSSLLFLRILDGLVFATSGAIHLKDYETRSVDIGLSQTSTRLLGVAELAGAVGVALGILPEAAAAGLIGIMLGAIHRKIFVWHIGFWGEKNSGWHYDLLFVAINLVIISSGGGRIALRSLR